MMDVRDGLGLQLESLISLKRNEDTIPYSMVFQNELRRS